MKLIVRTEDIQTTPTKKGPWITRRLVCLSDGELDQQLLQIDLDKESGPVGCGSVLEVHVRKIRDVFQGIASLIGDVKSVNGKAYGPAAVSTSEVPVVSASPIPSAIPTVTPASTAAVSKK